MHKIVLFFCAVLFAFTSGCKINLKVRSTTKQPFQIEILIPSTGLHTERATFTKERSEKKVKINAENCSGKHWTFRTYKQTPDGEWVKAQEHTGRFDGQGDITVQVASDYIPRVTMRQGVYCGETLLCG